MIIIKCLFLCIGFWLLGKLFSNFISDYDKCYSDQENAGYAVFGSCPGVCGGTKNTEYLSEMCIDCPYFVYISVDISEAKNND